MRNAWTREYEGVFQEEFVVRRVEPHEARVYVLRFERKDDGPNLLKKLASQTVKDMDEATEQGHLVELDEMRKRVKLLELRSDDLKRVLRNAGTGLTPLVEGCVDVWTERFPEQAHDKDGKSCFWKHKWGQCTQFASYCARTCSTCNPGMRTRTRGRGRGEARSRRGASTAQRGRSRGLAHIPVAR